MKMLRKVIGEYEKKFILNNIREEDKEELTALFGQNWYKETLAVLKNNDFFVLYGFDEYENEIPVAMGGYYDFNEPEMQIACVLIISSSFVYRNKLLFLTTIKSKLQEISGKYKIMYNYIYKKNYSAKRWLKKLGFKFDNPRPDGLEIKEDFEFFYKLN